MKIHVYRFALPAARTIAHGGFGVIVCFIACGAVGQDDAAKPNPDSANTPHSVPGGATKGAANPMKSDQPAITSGSVAQLLLGSLTPDHMKQLGHMLELDWKNRPEWGDMAVALLKGERMRIGMGWWRPSEKRYDFSWLRGRYDANGDGQIDREELVTDVSPADQLFARLDRDLDGRVSAMDLEADEPMNPADMTARMASYLFYRLDKDSNGRLSVEELADFFATADAEGLRFLTPEDVRAALIDPEARKASARPPAGEPPPSEMIRMFLSGEMGWLESGPRYGDMAPDFTLDAHDGAGPITLADSRGKRPVVLIFGSFT